MRTHAGAVTGSTEPVYPLPQEADPEDKADADLGSMRRAETTQSG
jgi:hypothetical protein